ncbi:MAG: alanine--tRNA ligase [Methylomicrobium sp.]|nr:alanine--tRNA ligase [Methylomicrobium sp.]
MKNMTSAELRSAFLGFFQNRGHSVQPSSSLVPGNDPTLLFTNAGMVQFKDVFLGREHRDYTRAVTSQRCVRAGGKHNDLENVGYTARHHTFFEMLGNFSFGDYFKEDAIKLAWEFLTQELNIPASKLWITVFEEDPEAEKIWLQDIGVDPERFSRIGAKDNFWAMGDVGPCGPCSEIFYDHGDGIPGGPPGSPDEEGDRYIEIWNLVFMQYDRDKDGQLHPLPKPSVDTGMGLERISAVMQHVHSNYEIDLFKQLLQAAARLAGTNDVTNSSLRVIADHIRSCAFLVTDGVMPSNEGRGYVLRRIIRRAIRHGYRLGIRDIFFYKLVAPLADVMGEAYPELVNAREQVERVLKKEEERFAETLEQGMKILEACVAKLEGATIPGEVVFQLYDTYGFPVDLTADFARENHLTVDHAGFETEMAAQRDRARAASNFGTDYKNAIAIEGATEFTGYHLLEDQAKIVGLFKSGQAVESLNEGEEGIVVLDKTPFYGESGGQAGDCGLLEVNTSVFRVDTTQKQAGDQFLHRGIVIAGSLSLNQTCLAKVDMNNRKATELNHSATHLLHAALRKTLGEHVVQKGSLVNSERLRFDFAHFEPVTESELNTIEQLVNDHIRLNDPVIAEVMDKESAMQEGAMALFGEKYGDEVRVLKIGDFSVELCGGTHVNRSGDIGLFKIVSETGVAAGIRRIEAVTGKSAMDWLDSREKALSLIAGLMKAPQDKAYEKVEQLVEKYKQLEKELEKLKSKLASSAGTELSSQAIDIEGVKVLAVRLDGIDPKSMREMVDQLRNKLGSSAVVLATVADGKVSLIAGVSPDQTSRIKAGDLVNQVASKVGGKGGGRPDMAQAGGNDPTHLDEALSAIPKWVEQQLSS